MHFYMEYWHYLWQEKAIPFKIMTTFNFASRSWKMLTKKNTKKKYIEKVPGGYIMPPAVLKEIGEYMEKNVISVTFQAVVLQDGTFQLSNPVFHYVEDQV